MKIVSCLLILASWSSVCCYEHKITGINRQVNPIKLEKDLVEWQRNSIATIIPILTDIACEACSKISDKRDREKCKANSALHKHELREELNIQPNDIPDVFDEIKHILCNDCSNPNNKKEICQKKICKRSITKLSIDNEEEIDHEEEDEDPGGEGKIETYLSKQSTAADRWPVIFAHLTDMMCQLCRDIKDQKNTNCVVQNCLNPTRK
ncbi:STAB1 [Mytilus edulis]|uniref:STAB1 n=1 Tax=Mytilus edulis TaxID=6550 RepID=A0A8S3U180_MYTED|nr:STAB1 [Mytilus edulis]